MIRIGYGELDKITAALRAQPSLGVLTSFDAGGKAREALEEDESSLEVPPELAEWDRENRREDRAALAAPQPQAGASEPLPAGVYFSDGNFYSIETRCGCGWDFYNKWRLRYDEFPTAALAAPQPQPDYVRDKIADYRASGQLPVQSQAGTEPSLLDEIIAENLAKSQAGASEPVAWCGWHPERGYNFATMADTEQGAVSRLMRTGIAGHHGWSVRQLVYATPSPTAAGRE